MTLLTTLLHQFGCFSSFLVEFHYKFCHFCKNVQRDVCASDFP